MTNTLTFETRAEIAGNTLRGHAAVFNLPTRILAQWEQIRSGAFAKVLAAGADVKALVNHDASLLLGRTSSGTLHLEEDSEGLAFELQIPDTSTGRDLRILVERGDLSGASFAFRPGEFERSKAEDGRVLITHTSFADLRDISPVTYPAYPETDIALRYSDTLTVREQLIRFRAGYLR